MKIKTGLVSFFAFLIMAFCFQVQNAYADLMIYPTRAFFGERDRVFDIAVLNTADVPAKVKLELNNLRQTENGAYERIDGPLNPIFDPEKIVIFSPKQVNLPAHEKQRVRISLRRPSDLPDGEYRAHLRMERLEEPKKLAQQPGKIVTNVTINLSYSVPIIVRQGVSDAVAKIGEGKLVPAREKQPAFLDIVVNRTGNYSTIGNLKVFWSAPGQAETPIGALNNFNIFPENSKRAGRIPLTTSNIAGGTLRVVYEGDGPDLKKTFDEKLIPVGG